MGIGYIVEKTGFLRKICVSAQYFCGFMGNKGEFFDKKA
jgi:hypothetical protein